jgi:hypothetical protein
VIDPLLEQKLQAYILPQLERGRKDFDRPHTEAVVYWMKELIRTELPGADATVLVTSAFAHDWGYIGLFDGIDSRDLELIHKMKPKHMERGAELITELIEKELSEYFTSEQKARVAHLVRIHDLVEEVRADDEVLLMEADTLGMLDSDRVKPTFTKADNEVFLAREFYGRRLLHFKHPAAKALAEQLAQKRQQFYE